MFGLGLGIGIGGPGSSGNPPVSGAVIVLDFSRGVTLNSGNISAIADQSGNGNNFTQGTAALQPPFSANAIAGTPGADTTAAVSAYYLQCVNNLSTILTGAASHRFMVIQANAVQTSHTGVMSQNDGSAGSNTFMPFTDGNFYDEWCSTTRQTVGALDAHTSPVVYDTVSSGTEFTASRNGTQFFTTATNTVGVPAAGLTILGGPSNVGWTGKLVYFLVYPFKVSGANYTATISFLRGRGSGF